MSAVVRKNVTLDSGYAELNAYFTRLGAIIGSSREIAPIAVITPMESVYLDYLRLDEQKSVQEVDEPFMRHLNELRKNGIFYHFVNEKILEKIGRSEDGKLIVGDCVYDAVVLADCRTVKKNTDRILKEFVRDGGKLCVLGEKPCYVDGIFERNVPNGNCAVSDLPVPLKLTFDGILSYSYREFGGKKLLFAVNESKQAVRLKTPVPFSKIDLMLEKGYAAVLEHTVPAEGSLLLEENGAYGEKYPTYRNRVRVMPRFIGSDRNNLTIERVAVTLKNGEILRGYVYGVFETLMKRGYADRLKASYSFESDQARPIWITREKQTITNACFNGKPLFFEQSEEDINFEIARAVANVGRNEYEYEADFGELRKSAEILYRKDVLESLLNCATYHTGLEPIYVAGAFDTDGYALRRPSEKKAGDLTKQGYADFYGKVCYEIELEKPITGYVKPIGAYAQCVIKAGGREYRCMLEEGVSAELPAGKIEIECYSTLRNRFGPFHYAAPYDDRITPDAFTLRNRWENEKTNGFFCEEKKVVPFGLETIEIECE